jgi:hypothetical protein
MLFGVKNLLSAKSRKVPELMVSPAPILLRVMQKDYIMRLIEEFFKALARIIAKRETKNFSEATHELDGLSKLVTGFGLEHLKSLGAEGIMYVFGNDPKTVTEKIYYTAKMLKEDGSILEAQNKKGDSFKSFELSKELFELVSGSNAREKEDAVKEIDELEKILNRKSRV